MRYYITYNHESIWLRVYKIGLIDPTLKLSLRCIEVDEQIASFLLDLFNKSRGLRIENITYYTLYG